jgi:hypothetical protein
MISRSSSDVNDTVSIAAFGRAAHQWSNKSGADIAAGSANLVESCCGRPLQDDRETYRYE